MTTRHFIDRQGNYVGGFGDGAKPPAGAVEVADPPPSGKHRRNGDRWDDPAPMPEEVREHAEKLILDLGREYTEAEIKTWPKQMMEAAAYQANPQTPVPFIEGLASRRGVPVADMVDHIAAKEAMFSENSSRILGAQGKLLAQDPIPSDWKHPKHWR